MCSSSSSTACVGVPMIPDADANSCNGFVGRQRALSWPRSGTADGMVDRLSVWLGAGMVNAGVAAAMVETD